MEGIQYRFLHTVCGKKLERKTLSVELLKLSTTCATNDMFDQANTLNKGVSVTAVETLCRFARARYAVHVTCMSPTRIPKIMLIVEVNIGKTNWADFTKFQRGLKNGSKSPNRH